MNYRILYATICAALISSMSIKSSEHELIEHVKKCIHLASQGVSKLPSRALELEGLSSPKVRYFLNNICSLPNSTYLEVGVWKGSTFVSALFGNQNSILHATAIDNWSEFDGPRQEFQDNCKLIDNVAFEFHEGDSFSIDKAALFKSPVNIYFYDGNHSAESHEKAFTYFNDILAPTFIAIVDDWNWEMVQNGTKRAFEKLGYTILFEQVLPARYNCDTSQWWNGLYVAVIKK